MALESKTVTPGAELPSFTLTWKNVDFDAEAHTFEVKTDAPVASPLTASASGSVVTIAVPKGAFDNLVEGETYTVKVWPTRSSDSKKREPAAFRITVDSTVS